MNASTTATGGRPLAALRRLTQPRINVETCELCSVPLGHQHRHLLESAHRRIVCACDGCAFSFQNVVGGRFQLIPRDVRFIPDLQLTDAQWDGFALPINLVFFFRQSASQKVTALYPSPAGATESLLPLETWNTLVSENPILATLQADVEALLVNRVGAARQYYLAPIDVCFELVGLIRQHWRGLSGGEEVWREISAFFARLEARHG